MILPLLLSPLPRAALCTIFGKRGLPCPVIPPCVSLFPCPVCSGLSMFVLSWGVKGGGERVAVRRGKGGGRGGPWRPVPSFLLSRKILAQGGSLLASMYLVAAGGGGGAAKRRYSAEGFTSDHVRMGFWKQVFYLLWGNPCTARTLRASFRLCYPRRAPRHAPWKHP